MLYRLDRPTQTNQFWVSTITIEMSCYLLPEARNTWPLQLSHRIRFRLVLASALPVATHLASRRTEGAPSSAAASSDGGLRRLCLWRLEAERRGRAPADAGLVATPPRRTPCLKDAHPVSVHRGAPKCGGYINRAASCAATAQRASPELPHVGKRVQERIQHEETKLDRLLGEERTRENMRAPASRFTVANFHGCFLESGGVTFCKGQP
jgi:hypothetical protein